PPPTVWRKLSRPVIEAPGAISILPILTSVDPPLPATAFSRSSKPFGASPEVPVRPSSLNESGDTIGLTPVPRDSPGPTKVFGQAPGPCILSNSSATAICCSLVARSARGANFSPPAASQEDCLDCSPPKKPLPVLMCQFPP